MSPASPDQMDDNEENQVISDKTWLGCWDASYREQSAGCLVNLSKAYIQPIHCQLMIFSKCIYLVCVGKQHFVLNIAQEPHNDLVRTDYLATTLIFYSYPLLRQLIGCYHTCLCGLHFT